MTLTETRPDSQTPTDAVAGHTDAGSIERLVGTGDHLIIGRTYMIAALFFGTIAAIGMALAGVSGASSDGFPGGAAPAVWNSSIAGLIVAGALPLLIGLGIYLVPLQVGSPAISFPRTVALSLWTWIVGVLIFAISVVTDGGIAGTADDASRLGNLALGLMVLALLGATVSIITTVVSHRPMGMGLSRTPLFSWSMLIAGPIWILNGSAVLAGVILGQVARTNAAGLSSNYDVMVSSLWKAPAIYMVAIPVLGIAGDVTAKVAGRRIATYGVAQGLIAVFGVFSFGVWASSGRAVASSAWKNAPMPTENIVFSVWVLVPGLAALALLGLYADTIRRSKLRITAAGLAGPLSILLVLGGVLSAALQVVDTLGKGNLVGFDAAQLGAAQTFFLVAAALCGAVGGTAFWGEKLWGHGSDSLAKPAVALVFIGGGLLGTVAAVQGILAASTPMSDSLYSILVAVTAGVLTLGLAVGLVSAVSAASAGHADPIADDPTGLTLEWSVPSPPSPSVEGRQVPAVVSPYPVLDLREGPASSEESK